MNRRVMAILLLLIFLLGVFLMAYSFLFTTGNTTLGLIGIGFVLPAALLSYRMRRELEDDDDYKKTPEKKEEDQDEK